MKPLGPFPDLFADLYFESSTEWNHGNLQSTVFAMDLWLQAIEKLRRCLYDQPESHFGTIHESSEITKISSYQVSRTAGERPLKNRTILRGEFRRERHGRVHFRQGDQLDQAGMKRKGAREFQREITLCLFDGISGREYPPVFLGTEFDDECSLASGVVRCGKEDVGVKKETSHGFLSRRFRTVARAAAVRMSERSHSAI